MEKEKVKFYKKKWFMWVCLVLLPPVGIALLWIYHKEMKKAFRIIITVIFVMWFILLVVPGNGNDATTIPETTTKPAQVETTEKTTTTTTSVTTTKSKLQEKDIRFYVSNVRNDVTGNWRVATIAESIQMQDYAVDYYNEYFEDDSEIHAIVNFNYNTTTQISVAGDTIFVTVYDYVKGEEHDAKLMFSGTVLKSYMVDKNTGEIE